MILIWDARFATILLKTSCCELFIHNLNYKVYCPLIHGQILPFWPCKPYDRNVFCQLFMNQQITFCNNLLCNSWRSWTYCICIIYMLCFKSIVLALHLVLIAIYINGDVCKSWFKILKQWNLVSTYHDLAIYVCY